MQPSEEVKSKLALEDIISERVLLKRSGGNFKGLCPFHEGKDTIFMVSGAKQIWHCFGCGQGGDILVL